MGNIAKLGLALFCATILAAASPAQKPPICIGCVSVRVGPPTIIRGPSADEADSPFAVIRLATGEFRGFTANVTSFAVDGRTPFDMGGARRKVLGAGPPGSMTECGAWLNSVIQSGDALLGLVHGERACKRGPGEWRTHKSMLLARSADDGLTWTAPEPIIEAPHSGADATLRGEGDCTAVNGRDGFLYSYCLRAKDWKTIAARAPLLNAGSGQWLKWDGNGWNAPAIGGEGGALGDFAAVSSAYWTSRDLVVLTTLRLSELLFSADKIQFQRLREPLVTQSHEYVWWGRPAPSDLRAYPSLIGADGSSDFDGDLLLAYTYVAPYEDFKSRYLVLSRVTLAVEEAQVRPQVGAALSRWIGARSHRKWTTSGPPVARSETFAVEKVLGYVMTKPPLEPARELSECAEQRRGVQSHFLVAAPETCEQRKSRPYRAAGWVYSTAQNNTVPLYQCRASEGGGLFGSNDIACEGLGLREGLLGFLLAR